MFGRPGIVVGVIPGQGNAERIVPAAQGKALPPNKPPLKGNADLRLIRQRFYFFS